MVIRLWTAALAVAALSLALPAITPRQAAEHIQEKRQAVALAAEARQIIGEELLGVDYSEITTTLGYKDAKLLSAAPDFPALLVQWLKEAGAGPGDAVAINASGSFPALIIAALAATRAVDAKPLLISSLGASSWGANRPDFTWLHMEKRLALRWPEFAGIAVSLGGDDDRGLGLPEEGRQALQNALALTAAPQILPGSASDAAALRMSRWKEANHGKLPAVLINIGGNAAYWGTLGRDSPRQEGLLLPQGKNAVRRDGVGDMFLQAGRPVIHLLGIKKIAAQHGITDPPDSGSPLWVTPALSHTARAAVILLLAGLVAALVRFGPALSEKKLFGAAAPEYPPDFGA